MVVTDMAGHHYSQETYPAAAYKLHLTGTCSFRGEDVEAENPWTKVEPYWGVLYISAEDLTPVTPLGWWQQEF